MLEQRGHSGNFGWAWLGLCLALALHITDEALTDFLAVYNPAVAAIRSRLPFLLLPTFTFGTWLTGLIFAVVSLLALTPYAFRSTRWMIPFGYGFASFMFANALQHIAASVYMGRPMPGVYSTPLLIVCSLYLLYRVRYRKGRSKVGNTSDHYQHVTE